mgnify:FL=1|tara:strand:- start:397 stop:1548 length:1152 start_codon:yes stop_codon:yes gene_type:complete
MDHNVSPHLRPFPMGYSDAEDWAHIAKDISESLNAELSDGRVRGGGIGLLYASDGLADDLRSIVTFLRQTTEIETWIGTLGLGVVAGMNAAFERPAAAAMVLDVPSDRYRLLPISPIPGRWPDEVMHWAETVCPSSGIVHGDATTPSLADMIETLAARSGAYLVGGLTCSRGAQHQIAGELGIGGLSGALFSPDVPVTVGLTQGCTPLGPSHEITGGEGNVVTSIDDRPALEVLSEDIGEILARDLQRVAGYVHVAFPVSGADTADYLVRNLMAVDRENGWIGVGTEVAPGERIMFVRRDPMTAQADLERMLRDVKSRMPGPARGAVYVSCVARGPYMFGDESAEAKAVAAALGDVPIIGFYAAGEISNNRLYGYTGVLMVFG